MTQGQGGVEPSLPLDRVGTGTYRRATVRLGTSDRALRALSDIAAGEGRSLSTALLSVTAALLHRYSGEASLLVDHWTQGSEGSSDRARTEPLHVTADFSGDPTFRALLRRMHDAAGSAGVIDGQSEIGGTSVAFAFGVDPDEMVLSRYAVVIAFDSPGNDGGDRAIFNAELLDVETMERLAGHFATLLEGAVASPDSPIALLPLLTGAEIRELDDWTDTIRSDLPLDRCLHTLVEEQAERTPDAVAVASERGQLTFRELDTRANHLANRLKRLGAGPERVVVVFMDRSLDVIVGFLSVLKAGAAYLPLDGDYSSTYLSFMLEDAAPTAILTQRSLVDRIPPSDVPIVCLDAEWSDIASESGIAPNSGVTPDNLAFVVYTSGSTGAPKGVMLTHRATVNNIAGRIYGMGRLTSADRYLQLVSLSFRAAVRDIFVALSSGAELYLAPPGLQRDPARVLKLIAEKKVTTFHAVVTILQGLLREDGWSDCTSLRLATVGGELMRVSTVEDFFDKAPPGCVLHHFFGVTETPQVAEWSCARGEKGRQPLGRPSANVQAYVLDKNMQRLPIGIPGEIFVGGGAMARGYLQRPDLTGERFIPNPFSTQPGDRLYRTGDLGRLRPDRLLEHFGRLDHQVKVGGIRIETQQVEAVLCKHPAVVEAAVTARDDVPGGRRLVAYIVPRGVAPPVDELRAFVGERLPRTMVPAIYVSLSAMPRTSNGKLNRRGLPRPSSARPAMSRPYVAPRTPTEEALAAIWRDVMGVDPVGVDDDFFTLGGTSVLAATLISRVKKSLGVDVPLRSLMASPTVAGLAESAERHREGLGDAAPLLDLDAELVLDPSIRPSESRGPNANDPAVVLLTGATGFVGAYILDELLRRTRARVRCLVRASGGDEARRRLREHLERYGLWSASYVSRVDVVTGDLALPLLGLPPESFDALSREIDVIYHDAALVNHQYPYATLEPVNVGGTETILRLACQGHAKHLHHVSTMAVGARLESDPLDARTCLRSGYAQSKWVGEGLVGIARARRLEATVYRLGFVVGHSETGVSTPDDFDCLLMKACVVTGAVVDSDVMERVMPRHIAPVDYVARALVHLSMSPESVGRTYHLANPRHAPFRVVADGLRASGYALRSLTYEAWLRELEAHTSRPEGAALRPLPHLLAERSGRAPADVHCEATALSLAGAALTCPAVDAAMFARYARYLVRVGFLPPPVAQ